MIDRVALERAAPVRAGASAAALAQIEHALGVKLPADYAELLAIKNAFRLQEPLGKLLQAARTPPVRLVAGEQLEWCAQRCREFNRSGRCLHITEHDDPARVIDENAAPWMVPELGP